MKIYIDKAHGCGLDRGASGFLSEEVYSDKMTDLVVTKLISLGHTVLAQRPTEFLTVPQSLNWRCQQANSWGADIFISNHNNAGGGIGAEVYTNNGAKLNEAVGYLQYIINNGGSVHSSSPKNASSGVKDGSGLAVINGTSMKAMLIENFFVDTMADCTFFTNNIEMFANALVYGITGVDLKNTSPAPDIAIDEMSFEGKPEVGNKITVYAHCTVSDVLYKYYYELNGQWTTATDWQISNSFSFIPSVKSDYKVVCHVKYKSNTTDNEDAYNYIMINITDGSKFPLPLKMLKDMMVYTTEVAQFKKNDLLTADAENKYAYEIELNGKRCWILKDDVTFNGNVDYPFDSRFKLVCKEDNTRVWENEVRIYKKDDLITVQDEISGYYYIDTTEYGTGYIKKTATTSR
ncbi:MAG: N-acetylmuramoyl-L-alanine amidase [Clostridium sp.]|uniref:N-acetylmuramoyl-L-alanine amidase n=1 Tax=Clostridium sp. TaxID=1506 RepID=UPI00305E4CEF